MEYTPLTQDLIERIEWVETQSHVSRVIALENMPGNPLSAQTRRFGAAWGMVAKGAPHLQVHRVLGLGTEDIGQIDSILEWFHGQNAPISLDLSPYRTDQDLLRALAERGLYQYRFLNVMYGVPTTVQPPPPVGIEVKRYLSEQIEEFADAVLEIEEIPETDRPVWKRVMTAQFQGWQGYTAMIGNRLASHGTMRVEEQAASFMFVITKPEFRGYGCQTALIHQRMQDAAEAGCDLVVAASYPGTTSQRNQERAGLRLAYQKALWTELRLSRR